MLELKQLPSCAALDPLPFISSFSPALDHLLALQKSVSRKTKDLEGEVRAAERSCEGRLREIDGGFEVSIRRCV